MAFDPSSIGPLVCCTVRLTGGRRTSLRLERSLWEALDDVARREGLTRNALLARLERQARAGDAKLDNFAGVVRLYLIHYFRAASHGDGGHTPAADE